MVSEVLRIVLAQRLKQPRGAFDIGHQERDRSGRQDRGRNAGFLDRVGHEASVPAMMSPIRRRALGLEEFLSWLPASNGELDLKRPLDRGWGLLDSGQLRAAAPVPDPPVQGPQKCVLDQRRRSGLSTALIAP
jgi:hypothetical protein